MATNDAESETLIAINMSKTTYDAKVLNDHLDAKQLHNADLFMTQQKVQGCKNGEILVLVKFPPYVDTRSCMKASFPTAYVRLTREDILKTGSKKLEGLLDDESYQRRAKLAATPLPDGIKYVLNMSPSTEEDDYAVALNRLSITDGIRLFYRSLALGAHVACVAGHDDACGCNEKWEDPYPMPTPPASILGEHPIAPLGAAVYLFDTKLWAVDEHRDIEVFSPLRQGANALRLFRSLTGGELHLDSAPRLWTIVGLFSMYEMTNYKLLRDQVTAWFSDSANALFVELLPEETIRVASVMKCSNLRDAAFRILVNERALDVAGGKPQEAKNITIFGRRSSGCLHGTDGMDKILQAIEHAGVAMADRYKKTLDDLCGRDALSVIDVQEWDKLLAVGKVIPDGLDVTNSYNALLSMIRFDFREAMENIIKLSPTDSSAPGHYENIEAALTYLVPKSELDNRSRDFKTVYATLNKAQKALCPFVWLRLQNITKCDFPDPQRLRRAAMEFSMDYEDAKKQRKLHRAAYHPLFDEFESDDLGNLFEHAIDNLKALVNPMVDRSKQDYTYMITPHMTLCLNKKEMDYIRLGNATAYGADIPEAKLGPSGPGPSFHTGITIPSVSDSITSDFEDLAINSDNGGGGSTAAGSAVTDDGNTTVHGDHWTMPSIESLASEQFTDSAMSAEYAEAEAVVPGHGLIFTPDATVDGSQAAHDDEVAYYGFTASDQESDVEFEYETESEDDGEGAPEETAQTEATHAEGAHTEGAREETAQTEATHAEGAHTEGAHMEGANKEGANKEGTRVQDVEWEVGSEDDDDIEFVEYLDAEDAY